MSNNDKLNQISAIDSRRFNSYLLSSAKERKRNLILGAIVFLAGLWQLLVLKFIAPICPPKEDGSFMRCVHTGKAAELMAILIIFSALILLFFAKYKSAGITLGLMQIFIGLGNLAIPLYYFPVCKMHTMRCVTGTKPNLLIVSAVLILLGLYYVKLAIEMIKAVDIRKDEV